MKRSGLRRGREGKPAAGRDSIAWPVLFNLAFIPSPAFFFRVSPIVCLDNCAPVPYGLESRAWNQINQKEREEENE